MPADVEECNDLTMSDEHEFEKIRQLADSIVKLCSSNSVLVLHRRAAQLQQLYNSWVHGFEVLIEVCERSEGICPSGAGGDFGCMHSSRVSAENELAQVKTHSLVADEFQSESLQPTKETGTHAFHDQGITFNINSSAGSSCWTPVVGKQGPAADSLMSLEVPNGTSLLLPSGASDSEDVMDILMTRSLLEPQARSPAIPCEDFQGDICSDITTLPADHRSSWGNNFISKHDVFDMELNLSHFQVPGYKPAGDCRNSSTLSLAESKEISLVCNKEGKSGENVLVPTDAQTLDWHGDDESRNDRHQNDSTHQPTVDVADVVNTDSNINAVRQSSSVLQVLLRGRDDNGNTNTVNDDVRRRSQILFKCDHCGKVMTTYEGLVEHLRLHTGERPLKCRYCDQSFASSANRAHHHRLHIHSRRVKCDYCDKSFVQLRQLQVHLRQHTGERPYSCDLCDKTYPSIYSLREHKIVIHDGIKRYKCELCNMEFSRSSKFHNHRRKHTGERPFTCQQCGKSFGRPGSLVNHKKTHTRTDRPYKCDVCEQEFPDVKSLNQHRRITSHSMKKWNCSDCSKSFTAQTALRTHINVVHDKNSRHVCQFCGKMWRDAQSLENHIRTHTGEKPFQCDVCSKKFAVKIQLDRHVMIHSGDKPFKCPKCDKSFTQSFSLVQHLRIHNNDRPHKCQLCDKAFHQSYALVKHMKTHAVVDSKK